MTARVTAITSTVLLWVAACGGANAQMFSLEGKFAPSGGQPSAIAVGDFNGDGKTDLAITDSSANTLTILLNNGAGGFSQATGSPFATGHHPSSIAVADFNVDGKLDLVTANLADNTISVFLGNGTGGFTQATGSPFAGGIGPTSLAVADFNQDGNPDIAIANASGVTILLGNRLGGFAPSNGSPFAAGTGPVCIAVGDFNDDGRPDLAVANSTSGNVTVLVGNGAGGFTSAAHSPFAVSSAPTWLLVNDFNNDGKQDLAIAGSAGTVSVLLGDGTGNFNPTPTSPTVVEGTPASLVTGDFDGDGNQDVISANGGSGTISILLGDGTGYFSLDYGIPQEPEGLLATGAGPFAIAVADFNVDRKPDLAIAVVDSATPANSNVGILLNILPLLTISPPAISLTEGPEQQPPAVVRVNSSSGQSGVPISLTVVSQSNSINYIAPSPMNAGTPTVVSVFAEDNLAPGIYTGSIRALAPGFFGAAAEVTLHVSAPAGTMLPAAGSPFIVPANSNLIAVADFDRDGNLDLVTGGDGSGQLSLFLGNGRGGFTKAPAGPFGGAMAPAALVTGDFNHDGNRDIAVANATLNTVSVWLGNGKGGFAAAPGSPFAVDRNPIAVVTGDFDGDGDLDIAAVTANGVTVLLGNGVGGFTQATGSPFAAGPFPAAIAAADFNYDGITDLAVANQGSNTVTVLLGTAGGNLTNSPSNPISVGNAPLSITAVDWSQGGAAGLVVVSESSITWITGDGRGNFITSVAPTTTFSPTITAASVGVGDFNGDGGPDLAIVANTIGSSVAINTDYFLRGYYWGFTSFTAGNGPSAVAAGDFNNDGRDDIAVVNSVDGTVSVLVGAQAPAALTFFNIPSSYPYNQVPETASLSISSSDPLFTQTLEQDVTLAIDGNTTNGLGPSLGPNDEIFLPSGAQALNVGTHTLTASFPAGGRYTGNSVSTTFQVTQAQQTISFGALAAVFVGVSPLSVTATATSGLTVSITSNTIHVCTVSGFMVTILAAGSCSLTATQAGNTTYLDATAVTESFLVRPATGSQTQTITFSQPANTRLSVNIPLVASASSGLAVSLVSTTPMVCSISGRTAITVNVGVCSIIASQPGNVSFAPAIAVSRKFSVTAIPTGIYSFFDGPSDDGDTPYFPVVADFNGDGIQDIAVSDGSSIVVLPGTAFGLSGARIVTPFATFARLVVGDWNGDGIPDLAAISATDGIVTPLINNGAGSFLPGNPFRYSQKAGVAAAADMNGDGLLDLVTVDDGGVLTVYLGDGAGGFRGGPAGSIPLLPSGDSGPINIVVADFNGDGLTDIAVATPINPASANNGLPADSGSLFVLTGDGTGNLTPAAGSPYLLSTQTVSGLAVGDFNGDGSTDLAVITDTALKVYLNNGRGNLTTNAPVTLTNGNFYNGGAIAGDFNGDGNLDIVAPNIDSSTVNSPAALVFFLGDGSGGFTISSYQPHVGSPGVSIATGDLNNDGMTDFVVAGSSVVPVALYFGSLETAATTLTGPATPFYGTNSTFQATVNLVAPGFYSLAGSVSFSLDGGSATTVPLSGGVAQFTLPGTTALGFHQLRAAFSGSPGISSSQGFSSFQIELGQSITFDPLGTVTFSIGSQPLTVPLSATATSGLPVTFITTTIAVCNVTGADTVTLFGLGTCSITALQSGDANYSGAIPVTQSFSVVSGGPPQLIQVTPFTRSPNTQTFTPLVYDYNGTADVQTISLLISNSDVPTAAQACEVVYTGPSLKLYNDAGSATLPGVASLLPGTPGGGGGTVSNSQCTLSSGGTVTTNNFGLFYAPIGINVPINITAAPGFTGDKWVFASAMNNEGQSSGWQFAGFWRPITGTSSATILTSSGSPATFGSAVILTAKVSPAAASGTVTFYDGANVLGISSVSSGGASFTTKLLAAGTRTLSAHYNGDSIYAPGSSTILPQTINVNFEGGFAPAVTYNLGDFPQSVVVADFNGDGKADIAVGFQDDLNGISVLMGNGDGTFQPPAAVSTGAGGSQGLVARDFNADGKSDLALLSPSGTVQILPGNGDGTFQPPLTRVASNQGSMLIAADFNGDGRTDVAIGDGQGKVLLGNGDGTLQLTLGAGPLGSAIAVGDFNGDGKADLAAADSQSNLISVAFGNGDGTFLSPSAAYEVGTPFSAESGICQGPVAIAAGDVNGDGITDLVTANCGSNSVSVLLGVGDGTFYTAVTYPTGINPQAVVLGDFNGDGKIDIATADFGAEPPPVTIGTISVLSGNGDGTFQPPVSHSAGYEPAGIAAADFNGDGLTIS